MAPIDDLVTALAAVRIAVSRLDGADVSDLSTGELVAVQRSLSDDERRLERFCADISGELQTRSRAVA